MFPQKTATHVLNRQAFSAEGLVGLVILDVGTGRGLAIVAADWSTLQLVIVLFFCFWVCGIVLRKFLFQTPGFQVP